MSHRCSSEAPEIYSLSQRGSTKPGVPRAWPLPLLCQISFLCTASHSLWGVWRSRGMKTKEVKYNQSSPSNSQAAQIRLWWRAVICLSSKLVRSGSPFLHWNPRDWSVLGEGSIITLLHLGHHCQIEGLGRSHFTQGKYFYSAPAKVQAASSPWSRRGAKHPLAFCLLRKKARKRTLQWVPASDCVLGCFFVLTCMFLSGSDFYILMYANFRARGSATNSKIEIGKENAAGCVMCPEKPLISPYRGKRIKHKKSRALSRRGETKEGFV